MFDENRYGGFLKQRWRDNFGPDLSVGVFSKVNYVSDSLFLREIEDEEVGDRQSRYTTSEVVSRATIGENITAEVFGEYVQDFTVDQDVVFQRLPQAQIAGSESFRPFGYNVFGIKFVPGARASAVDFVRRDGYDGWRTNLNPYVSMPLRYKNYFNSSFNLGVHKTYYDLRSNELPNSTDSLSDSSFDRNLSQFSYAASTAVERVFDLDKDSWLVSLTSLGSENQENVLARLKHSIEPQFSYLYIPDTSQNELPRFDSFDRIDERSVFTYGLRTSLLGRFLPRNRNIDNVAELTPLPSEIPAFPLEKPLEDFGLTAPGGNFGSVLSRKGEIRELVVLSVRQSFDYKEHVQDDDPLREEFSDIGSNLSLFPTPNFGLDFGNNYSPYNNNLSEWNLGFSVRDDRGDVLRTRVNYVRDPETGSSSVSQVATNIEVPIADRLKLGYYMLYDDRESEFIENHGRIRLSSACNCWHLDLGYVDTLNPDRQTYLLSFTLVGLGDISQDLLTRRPES